MLNEIEQARNKIQKRITTIEAKLDTLEDDCKERWDVNWYGCCKWEEEFNKKSKKLNKELMQLQWWHKQLYEMHLAAVEFKIEEGTETEKFYLS